MRSTPWGCSCGIGCEKTLWCHVLSRPMQLGPMSAAPCLFTVCRMCSSSKAPSCVSSPKPAERMMKAFVPFSVSTSTASGQAAAGMASTAKSAAGASCTDGQAFTPCTSASLGLTAANVPAKCPFNRLRRIAPPGLCMLFDAPTIRMLSGWRSCRLIIAGKRSSPSFRSAPFPKRDRQEGHYFYLGNVIGNNLLSLCSCRMMSVSCFTMSGCSAATSWSS